MHMETYLHIPSSGKGLKSLQVQTYSSLSSLLCIDRIEGLACWLLDLRMTHPERLAISGYKLEGSECCSLLHNALGNVNLVCFEPKRSLAVQPV